MSNTKIACVYHSVDLDGWMSAAIVKHWFIKNYNEPETSTFETSVRGIKNMIEFIGYNYGQPIPDLLEYDKVIMCDISFTKDIMLQLNELNLVNGGEFIWLDHHTSAIKDIKGEQELLYIKGKQDTNFAACELTWKYFFLNETMPEIVRLLGLYDSFRHKNTEEEQKVLEFQYGARQCISNYEEAYDYLIHTIEIFNINDFEKYGKNTKYLSVIQEQGKVVYKYLCTEAKQTYKNGFEVWFSNGDKTSCECTYKFICINKERFNPINFGIDYHKDGYDGAACFHYADGVYNFSLYNDNGKVDCSQIAKQYGGGGHKGAAGMRLTSEQFLKLTH